MKALLRSIVLAIFTALAHPAVQGEDLKYVPAMATYILPETTSEESGYFSLSESLDGKIHVGTAKYNANAYLVEFDPATGKQRIVLDTNKTCGLTATGYAAQAKLHTRNFVGRSGRVYVGSKQGYAAKGDTQEYPGGYVMTYDPRTGRAENLGMPLRGQGVIDVVADEGRSRIYAVSCEEQHWMLGVPILANITTGNSSAWEWRELGPMLTPYAATLLDSRGTASVLTKEFALAQCDPATNKITTRPILVDGKVWMRADNNSIPIWQLDPDGRHAWLILMNDPTLLWIDLQSPGDNVVAESRGKMLDGKKPDCRSALTIHPDGSIYALIRVDNPTQSGSMLHHLVRYSPKTNTHEDLGVLKVQNPDYYDWSPGPDGKPKHHSHGFHRLADGTLTPLHAHMALLAAHDGTLYATILYPFTLLKIDGYKVPAPKPTAGAQYLDALDRKLDEAAARLPEIARLAEQLATRYMKGGLMGFPWIGSTLEQELVGRSGGVMHIDFDRAWKAERTPEEKAQDVMIYAWDDAPKPGDLKRLQDDKAKGRFIVGFGARKSPLLAEHVAACDAWIDSGNGENDRVVPLAGGRIAGKTNHFTNAVQGWLLMGEFVGALTRQGKMPTMWKSYAFADGHDWSDKYFKKAQYHDEFKVPTLAAGEIGQRYLERIRYMVRRLESTELPQLCTMAERIDTELRAGRKTIVASAGHMAMNFVGRFDDKLWAANQEVHGGVEAQMKGFEKTDENALVLRLGEWGLEPALHQIFQKKHQRVMLLTGENPRPEYAVPAGYDLRADYGAAYGDACVRLEGYPIGILPPSGVMQLAAYETIDVEVLARQGK